MRETTMAEVRLDAGKNRTPPRLGAMNWLFRPHPAHAMGSTVAKGTEKLDPGSTIAWNRGNVS